MGRRGVLLSGIAIMAIFVTGAGRASLIHRNTNLPNPVRLRKVADTATDDVWFDCDLLLNQDMVATIGNRGSGKSALADVLALAGDTPRAEHFSFLTKQKFREKKLAAQFDT